MIGFQNNVWRSVSQRAMAVLAEFADGWIGAADLCGARLLNFRLLLTCIIAHCQLTLPVTSVSSRKYVFQLHREENQLGDKCLVARMLVARWFFI